MDIEIINDRITRTKCSFCGKKVKKVAKLIKNKEVVGCSIVCCGCGHVENFAFEYDTIPIFVAGMTEGRVDEIQIECAAIKNNLRNTCNKLEQCPCKPKLKPEIDLYDHQVRDNNNAVALKAILEAQSRGVKPDPETIPDMYQ